jgi:hypothetical protein
MDVLDRWERWAPVSGLVFAVSFLVLFFAFFVPGELPASADGAQIADYYRGRGPAGFLLMYSLIGLSGIGLLWFTGSLRASLRRVEPGPGSLADVAYGGGLASAILLAAGGTALLAPFAVIITSTRSIDPSVYTLLGSMGFLAINLGLFGQAVQVVATSVVALRWGGLPRWFAWVGFLVALALVLNLLYFFGLWIWVAWVVLASSLLLTRPVRRASLAVRAAAAPPQPLDAVS